MRIRTMKSHRGSLMYVFEFESKEAVDAFFHFYQNLVQDCLSDTSETNDEEWLRKFKEVIQNRTDDKYGYEDYPYSGFLFYDEIIAWIFGMEDIVGKQLEQIDGMVNVMENLRKTFLDIADENK